MPFVQIVKSIISVFVCMSKMNMRTGLFFLPQTNSEPITGVLQGSKVLDGHGRGERHVHADDQEPPDGRRWTLHLHSERVQRSLVQRLPRS